jgi:hypothetical protein
VDERIWRVRPLERFVAWSALVAIVPFGAIGVRNAIVDGRVLFAGVMFVACVLHMVGCWRVGLRPRVVAGSNGVEVRNAFTTRHVSWEAVLTCMPTRSGLAIVQRDGRLVMARAVQRTNGSTRAEVVAYQVRRRSMLVATSDVSAAPRRNGRRLGCVRRAPARNPEPLANERLGTHDRGLPVPPFDRLQRSWSPWR